MRIPLRCHRNTMGTRSMQNKYDSEDRIQYTVMMAQTEFLGLVQRIVSENRYFLSYLHPSYIYIF